MAVKAMLESHCLKFTLIPLTKTGLSNMARMMPAIVQYPCTMAKTPLNNVVDVNVSV